MPVLFIGFGLQYDIQNGYDNILSYQQIGRLCYSISNINITIHKMLPLADQKQKKPRPHQLGPLTLSKSHYKPYFGSQPHKRPKENLLTMGPLENIMFDVPPIEETQQPLQYSAVEKLRIRIGRWFGELGTKSKDQWELYVRKSQIVETGTGGWTEVETFLLKIVGDLFQQWKNTLDVVAQLQKFKQQTVLAESQNYLKSPQRTKLQQKHTRNISNLNTSKADYSLTHQQSWLRPNLNHNLNNKHKNICRNGNGNGQAKFTSNSIYASQDSTIMHSIGHGHGRSKGEDDNLPQLKISKLEKEIQLYRERLRNMEEQTKMKVAKMEKKIEEELEMKYSETLQEKMKYENEVESKKFYGQILTQQFKMLKKKYLELQTQHEAIKKQYIKLKADKTKMQSLYQYKEMWLMQSEQILQLNITVAEIRAQKDAQINKSKGLKQKLKEVSKNFNYNYNVSMENEKDKQDLNKVLKDFRDWLKFFAVPRISKGMMNNNTFFPEMNVQISGKENYQALLPKDDTTNYKLLRPNFFIYFEAYEGIILTERKFPQRKVMPPSYYLTIRAILDSMYLHFNFVTDFKQWLSFPEYVISFLQKFEINLQTKKPICRKIPCQSQQKINFLLNIFNIEAANSWQCQTFRNFIMQQFTLDELYFYLDCRDHLLKGSQLNNNFGSSDSITYIRVGVAEEVIRDRLRNYDREMLERMKKFLNSKKKVKNGKELIDVNFVLKLLLEVYSIEKVKSQRFFYHNFKTKTPSIKISYTEYSAFMAKNFDFLTKNDIARLYRQIYTLGVSHITYKTIHYVCSMRGLFIPLLRQKLSTKVQISRQPKYPKVFDDILYLHLQNSLNNMAMGLEEYGVEEFLDNNIKVNKFLHDCQGLRIHRSNFTYKLLQQTEKILKIKAILSWKNQKSIVYQQLSKEQVRQKLSHLLAIVHQTDDDINSLKKWKQNRNKAMMKLTRNFKIRIQQSLAEFKIVDKKEYEVKIAQVDEMTKKIQNDESQKEAEVPFVDDKDDQ